ncbi:hypothetical protein CPAR01_11969 [Colletotrichum paranaense]|uniref:Uncharacterized protein n=8 Tax=Colletotrichum acutatum species complex TaxID=2707335 RepID=A0A9P7REF4_9PEZI|nr:uncharacterized protein HER10_EVM0009430 [Colletotrichum scovillei]XP_049145906.1 uncharacterized protein CLUP02_09784 [Colletotrichum lupini]XP_060312798.1 uncharacterized protein CCOS01_08363 [Colletotrichum costaricense]XP_060345012.1 uncharacterized protein CPAR01_11969 [Colletotrichum paranaense]XP_060375215.1 uncharacterized protein CTAM01_14233 [Colletotrichum tamarilloi]KAI3542586.1 hypothetical protein CSPX01_06791 [Colletotrichum filicis]KAK0369815.1 hypothetical protein CLIM01_1
MKFTTITTVFLSGLFTTAAAIDPAVYANSLQERQVAGAMETQNLVRAESILNSARSGSVGNIRRRRLREAQERQCVKQPATECNKCMDTLVGSAIFEVMECGIAALGVGAIGGGTTAALAAMGFLACDGAVYNSYEKGLIECRAF